MATRIPQLKQYGNTKQLIVDGEPFLMLGAELQNSSLSSAEYMEDVWGKLRAANINTVLGAVTWEMIEPEEGRFDFLELDKVVIDAREHGLHLILLWFGSWKNGRSTYVPSWVKTNPGRFPRAELRRAGGVVEISDVLSVFHDSNLEADIRAFQKLLSHLQETDENDHTVLMIQVENEVGLLSDSRDGSATANEKFVDQVPAELVQWLSDEFETLHPDLKRNLSHFRSESTHHSGSWEDMFGRSAHTDELFMAYHYARYVNRVAAAGKVAYPLPMFTNVWLNYAGGKNDNDFPIVAGGGGEPGDYPSGGAVSSVLDIWLRFAPDLDFVAPDIYLNDYSSTCRSYRHRNNALFVPEQRRDAYGARRIWIAYGSYQALLASPFGIDTVVPATNPFTKHYALLSQVSRLVLEAQRNPDSSIGFCFDNLPSNWKQGDKDPARPIHHHFGDWNLTIERSFVFGKPGPSSGMIIHRGGARFLLIGWGFQVKGASAKSDTKFSGILKFEEKTVVDRNTGTLGTVRTLGGDETRSGQVAIMPNEEPDYGGFPIAVTIPARTAIAEVEFYSF